MDNLVHLLVTSQSGLFFSSGYCNPLVPRSQPHTTSFLICPSGLSSFPSLFWISPRNFKFSFYFVEQFLIPLNLCSQTWAHIYISQLLHAQQNKRDFHVTNVFRRLSLYVGPMFSAVVIQHWFVLFFFLPLHRHLKCQTIPTSVVVQWSRICLPMQGTWVQSLAQKIPHAMGQLSPCATTTEPVSLEPALCNVRSHHDEKPADCNKE